MTKRKGKVIIINMEYNKEEGRIFKRKKKGGKEGKNETKKERKK